MGVREIDRFLEPWEMNAKDLHRRLILAPTPRERERWHAIWLLAQGWTASATAEALGWDPPHLVKGFRRDRWTIITGLAAGVALASVFAVLALQAWPSGDTLQIAAPIAAAGASLVLIPILTYLNTL